MKNKDLKSIGYIISIFNGRVATFKKSLKILGEKYSLAWWLWQRRSFLDWLATPVKELEIKAK